MREWQPIETAPKDTQMLVGAWEDDIFWCHVYAIEGDRWEEDLDDAPTHWMPLPEPPPK